MRRGWSCLALGIFLSTTLSGSLALAGCQQQVPPEEPMTPLALLIPTETAVPSPNPTPTFPLPVSPFLLPDPLPTPTVELAASWPTIGYGPNSLQFAVPPHWVDMSDRLPQEVMVTPLGVVAGLAVDSARAGASLVAGKSIGGGGFVVVLVAPADVPPMLPVAGLGLLLADLETAVTPRNDITTLQVGDLSGAAIDVAGMPIPVFGQAAPELFSRLVYFLIPGTAPEGAVQVIFLLSTSADQWDNFAPTFTRISETAVLPDTQAGLRIPHGTLHFLSGQQTETRASGSAAVGAPEIWLLDIPSPQYLTLSATPLSSGLDLVVTLTDPTGNILHRLNNSFIGDSERATDLPLPDPGLYLLTISDFAAQLGRYNLEVHLHESPAFAGEGRIRFGEGVQSQLAAESQHVWFFQGTAGQYANIVLQPGSETLDAILNIYDPEGRRLVALDEGFSGDPEVVSGFQLPVTGEYAIRVSTFASAGGSYVLSLSEGRQTTANFYDAGDLLMGQFRRETLRPREAHAWFFNGRRDEEVIVRVMPLSSVLDLDLWLLDPTIQRLAAQDLFLAGEPEFLQHRLPQDGQYLILVRDFAGNAGAYEIGLELAPTAVPVYEATLSSGLPATRFLPAAQTSFWLFNGVEGETVTIVLEPADEMADLVLILQAPDGHTLRQVDAGGSGEPEMIADFNLVATGQWRILVQEFFAETATYTITATWE